MKDSIPKLLTILYNSINDDIELTLNILLHDQDLLSKLNDNKDRYILTALLADHYTTFTMQYKKIYKGDRIISTLQKYIKNLDYYAMRIYFGNLRIKGMHILKDSMLANLRQNFIKQYHTYQSYKNNICNDKEYQVFSRAKIIISNKNILTRVDTPNDDIHTILTPYTKIRINLETQSEIDIILKSYVERQESCVHLLDIKNIDLQWYLYISEYSPLFQLIEREDGISKLIKILRSRENNIIKPALGQICLWNRSISPTPNQNKNYYIILTLLAIDCKQEYQSYDILSTLQGYIKDLDSHELYQYIYELCIKDERLLKDEIFSYYIM